MYDNEARESCVYGETGPIFRNEERHVEPKSYLVYRSARHTMPVVTTCDICECSRRIESSPQEEAINEMVQRTKGHLTTLNVQ
jgi:hypothetical protein